MLSDWSHNILVDFAIDDLSLHGPVEATHCINFSVHPAYAHEPHKRLNCFMQRVSMLVRRMSEDACICADEQGVAYTASCKLQLSPQNAASS